MLEDANVVKIDDISKPRIHKIKNDMWMMFLGMLMKSSITANMQMHKNVYL